MQTIDKWQSVRKGEEVNIFPFIEAADAMFNSSLEYEMAGWGLFRFYIPIEFLKLIIIVVAVLSVFVSPLLRTVPPNTEAFLIARNLINFLEHFQPIPANLVPSTSLLREFIGGSDFE
jgi:uridine kinase